MRVGISLLTLVPGEIGGSETYARALTASLAEHGTLEYTAFVPTIAADAGGGLPSEIVLEYRARHTIPGRLAAMARGAARSGPLRRRMRGVDAVHFPLTVPIPRVKVPFAITLNDLQHRDLPELFSRGERAFRHVAYDHAARTASAVIVISEFVRGRAIELLGLPPERVHAVALAVDHERFQPGDGERRPVLLYPARRWPHKNHERLLEGFALLRRERPELRLVLTGGGHEGHVVPAGVEVHGNVSSDGLARLYRQAAALVFPSLYEGFGLPPLEAMACGCPVAASTAASLPETCGDAARLFDPRSPEAIAEAVRDVLENPDEWRRRGLERAARFTWEATARAHERVYAALSS